MSSVEYLKTKPGIAGVMAGALDALAFICLCASGEQIRLLPSVRGLITVYFFAVLSGKAVILCHILHPLSRRIPPYPFAFFQVRSYFVICIDVTKDENILHLLLK